MNNTDIFKRLYNHSLYPRTAPSAPRRPRRASIDDARALRVHLERAREGGDEPCATRERARECRTARHFASRRHGFRARARARGARGVHERVRGTQRASRRVVTARRDARAVALARKRTKKST